MTRTLRELYLHHLVERPLRRNHAGLPVLRAGQHFLMLCRSPDEAAVVARCFEGLVKQAGLHLEGKKAAISRLKPGDPAPWHHLNVVWSEQGMELSLSDRALHDLQSFVLMERIDPNNIEGGVGAIRRWTHNLGPCPPRRNNLAGHVHFQVKLMLMKMRFAFRPGKRDLTSYWERAHADWEEARRACASQS